MNTEIIENTLLTLINEFKKDEEEKYNSVSNTIKSIHKSFLEEEKLKTDRLNEIFSKTKTIIKEVKEEMKTYPPQFCIFNAINLQKHENYNSNLIAKLLEVNIKYVNIKYKEDTELSFVKDFLMYLNNKFNWSYGFNDIKELKHSDIIIKREEYAGSRRIDLFISYKKDFAIIIENKIYAGEQDNQLDDYYKNKKDDYKNLYMIFLTPSGYEPYTLSEKSKKELGNNFQILKHSDIALWLESILENKKYYFLHEKNILFKDNDNKYIKDYRLLKSAMIQTIHNANMISNNTKELDMTKVKIQKLLEDNIFKDIQTVEDVEEYRKIFTNVIDIINKKIEVISMYNKLKKYWQFTQEIETYLENKKINKYDILSYDKFEHLFKNNDYVPHIKMCLSDDLYILMESCNYENYIGFGIVDKSDKMKSKIKNSNFDIKSIFNKIEEWNDGHWIYWAYIDTEKDRPEEIAEAMINLYNLLKNKLKSL
ncbi:PD-(D/E)XK nuclease family protein [uncultured Brachyspira sp.]|uniref:PDDEXK-like family protein n=1 Tax=uncultured Brachyspira sp. TaxID=221953 RepID=UPI0025EBB0BD|nr:PD-(D/E)XK nuclease family protein [uncultured Brachyspira sp.]